MLVWNKTDSILQDLIAALFLLLCKSEEHQTVKAYGFYGFYAFIAVTGSFTCNSKYKWKPTE